jgi:hypothetical protein
MSNLISSLKKIVFNLFLFFMPIWARFFRIVARTGKGTNICLNHGFLPLPIDFYSPVPDLLELEAHDVWNKKSSLTGIDFNPDEQVKLLCKLGESYGMECSWPGNPTENKQEFYTENNAFSFGCAAALHTIIRTYRPNRIIEIGSGNSSKVISAAILLNSAEGDETQYFIIDPYVSKLTEEIPNIYQIIKEKVEFTDIKSFIELGNNDILFIDSGHTVRTGSDVNYLFLDVLPRLAPGVIIHVHDINLPYEYPKAYYVNSKFRVFWTEAYLLQAFLCFNSNFKTMLAMNYLIKEHWEDYCNAFPHFNPDIHKLSSGSFWMRRIS